MESLTQSLIVSLLTSCALATPSGKDDVKAEKRPHMDVKVTLRCPKKFFKGLPCISEMTARNRDAAFRRLTDKEINALSERESRRYYSRLLLYNNAFPDFNILSQEPPISLEIRDASTGRMAFKTHVPGDRAFWVSSPAVVERPKPRERIALFPGESKAFSTDLGRWFHELPPGTYLVTLLLYQEEQTPAWKSDPVTVTLDELDARVGETLEAEGLDRKTWITRKADASRIKKAVPGEVYQTIVPYLFIDATLKAGSVAKTTLEPLADFPEHLQGLAACLRYEVLRTRGEDKAADTELQNIVQKYPSLKWRAEAIKENKKAGLLYQALGDYADGSAGKSP